mgnify:CR=1 FL=1
MSEKINVMLTTENMEQLQMAAMVASVGAVSGNDVSVFLSMNALKYFVKGNDHKAPIEGEMGNVMLEKKVPPFLELFEQAAHQNNGYAMYYLGTFYKAGYVVESSRH